MHAAAHPKHIHILGIGGTFMGGLAQIARQMGYKVTGQDNPLYPPMSDQLATLNIELAAMALMTSLLITWLQTHKGCSKSRLSKSGKRLNASS